MSIFDRREMMRKGLMGLAAGTATGLALRADANPTPATEDAHDYLQFVSTEARPTIMPTNKWSPTGDDILGPYYLPGTPFRGKVTAPFEPGTPLLMSGRVWGFDSSKPLAHATLHIWQADDQGNYDMVDPRNPPKREKFRNRIRIVTDETGYYEYETIKPAPYALDAQGKLFRPAHIHYLVEAAGYQRLITQLYFAGDPHIKNDRWASKSELIVKLNDVKVTGGTYQHGVFDIVLAKVQV